MSRDCANDKWTSIAVTRSTRDELENRGKKRETFNDVIRRLLGMKLQERP